MSKSRVPEDLETRYRKSMQWRWWLVGVVVAIVGAGWTARGWLEDRFASEKTMQHRLESHRTTHSKLSKRMHGHEEHIQDIRYVNVRIEVGQKQINDRLERLYVAQQDTRTRREREERDQTLEELGARIEARGKALDRSFKQRPVIPSTEIRNNDPLRHAQGL